MKLQLSLFCCERSSVIKPSEDQDIVDIKMSFIIVICLLRITGRWGFQMFSRGDHLTTEPIVQSLTAKC